MGHEHHVVEVQETGIDRGFVLVDVERGAGDHPLGAEGVGQRVLVHDRAPAVLTR